MVSGDFARPTARTRSMTKFLKLFEGTELLNADHARRSRVRRGGQLQRWFGQGGCGEPAVVGTRVHCPGELAH